MGATCTCDARNAPLTQSLEGHYSLQLLRSMGYIHVGGGDVNEMFLAAQQCGTGGDALQWNRRWEVLAEKTFKEGNDRIEENPSGAATALLRSCNYSRTGAFFIRGYPEHEALIKKATPHIRPIDLLTSVTGIQALRRCISPRSSAVQPSPHRSENPSKRRLEL